MAKSKRLDPIIKLAKVKEDGAAQAMGVAMQQLETYENQLKDLKLYKDEYMQNIDILGTGGITLSVLRSYRQFINQLDDTIKQQEGVVQQSRQYFEKKRDEWMVLHTKTNALSKAKERFKSQEEIDQLKFDQKQSDDYSQRKKHY